MKIKPNQIAVVTGGGSGIGRALSRQLTAIGVHVSMCDLSADSMAETRKLCLADAPPGTRVSTFTADVSQEAELLKFRDAVLAEHNTQHINLLINNAGIGGGGGFVAGDRSDWERTFGICWHGVYYGCRAFMPLLVAATEGHLVNVSSVNGFWASLGPGVSHTAYASAKFAVKGFTEALVTDLRLNAPHVQCSVVMPGHIGTSISLNTTQLLGHGEYAKMTAERLALVRNRMVKAGAPVAELSDDAMRKLLQQRAIEFRDNAPTSADQAASIILNGVREGRWRILVGEDAERLDNMVRSDPEAAYEPAFANAWRDGKPSA
jgi:NAD(P)-dependent dehydrogenase (short-subunit alcohol dehydrogenase family)